MEFRQLRYFISVVNHKSFTKASEKLFVAQPALSRHIQLLEEEFGVQLLVRRSRGVEVTEAGQKFKARAEYILQCAADIKGEISQVSGGPAGHVVVGIPPSLISILAPRLLEMAAQRYPALTVRIIEGLSVFLCDWLDQSRLDLALLTDYGVIAGLDRQAIYEEELVFVGSPAVLTAFTSSIPMSAIDDYSLIITHGFREIIEPWLTTQDISPTYLMELDSIAVVKDMLLKGGHCSIISYGIVHDEVSCGRLKALRLEPSVHRRIILALKSNRTRSINMQAVESMVSEVMTSIPLGLP